MGKSRYVGVIGAGSCNDAVYELACNLSLEIGKRRWVLVCGGLGGIMEGAAKGSSEAGGMTIGILPGLNKESANSFIQVPIPTGLGEVRNLLVVRASDVLISIAGEYGTLSEIALALKANKPVIGLETWEGIRGVHYVSDYRVGEASQDHPKGLARLPNIYNLEMYQLPNLYTKMVPVKNSCK